MLIPLRYQSSKLILIGDPLQLSATVKSQIAQEHGLGQSLFERLYNHFSQMNDEGMWYLYRVQLCSCSVMKVLVSVITVCICVAFVLIFSSVLRKSCQNATDSIPNASPDLPVPIPAFLQRKTFVSKVDFSSFILFISKALFI